MQKSRFDELHLKMTEQAELAVINDTVVMPASMPFATSSGVFNNSSSANDIPNILYVNKLLYQLHHSLHLQLHPTRFISRIGQFAFYSAREFGEWDFDFCVFTCLDKLAELLV